MPGKKSIIIVGGGLAGLTLGIGLRQLEIPVSVFEAGRYPRHRVCGEFISGRGQATLARLGLLDLLRAAGARTAHTAAFFSPRTAGRPRSLPQPALCLSRHALDAALAAEFQRLGGDLHEQTRWRQKEWGEGSVRATGRRVQVTVEGWRFFGLKAHARQVELSADLEMHLGPNGYIGVCRLPDGAANICGLFRSREALPELLERWRDWLSGPPDSLLREKLAGADFDPNSFCSVAGISLQPQDAQDQPECALGDALTMIPPVTGNGMSMAFESAELAIAPLVDFSRGETDWMTARRMIARRLDDAFGRRLAWAGWLQRRLFEPIWRDAMVSFTARFDFAWNWLFEKTR